MKYNQKRALRSLGVGLVLTIPILCVYVWGEGSEDTLIDAMAQALMTPAMVLAMPLLLLAPFVADSDRYVLGAFFYAIPFVSVVFYALCAYAVLSFIPRKK